MNYKSKFLNILKKRGYLHQLTDETKLDDFLSLDKCVAYIGFDCTASSLHVGSFSFLEPIFPEHSFLAPAPNALW